MRVAYPLRACGMGWLLGAKGLSPMIPWLAGAAMAWLVAKTAARPVSFRARFSVWAIFVIGVLALGFFKGVASVLGILIVAGLTCSVLWVETRPSARPANWISGPAVGLSEISYTLYATHLPLVVLLHALWLGNQRLPLSFVGISISLAISTAACGFAYGWWWLFEKRTNAVRDYFRQRLRKPPFVHG